jgi:uncharacterized protein (TIGR00255 family)
MTGHGRGESHSGGWAAVVECYSVNRKNAEVVCHGERSAAWLEPALRERVLEKITRGRVQVNVALEHSGGTGSGILDAARAKEFVDEARALQSALGLSGEVTIRDLLAAPGVVRQVEPEGDGAREAALSALSQALEGLVETRRKEGAALARVLTKSVGSLRDILKRIHPRAAGVAVTHRDTLLRRIALSGVTIPADDPRLLTEIALFADRSDITEELDRAASHLDQFQEILASGGPSGRTMEFLAQELGREFNTIGSKSSDTAIARLVIEAKSELDRIREQVANIE